MQDQFSYQFDDQRFGSVFFKCYAWILCWKMHVISKSSPDYKLGIYWVGQGQLKMIPEEICTVITFLALKFEHHSIHQLN